MDKPEFYQDDSLTLDEFNTQKNIDLTYFNNLIKCINICFKTLGINNENKCIYYQRYNNKTSMLAVKLNNDENNDRKNYLIFGAEEFKYNNCNIYMHADAKISQLAMKIASNLSYTITSFFNDFEKYLKNNNEQGLEIKLCITLENKKNHELKQSSISKKIKHIFKKK